ncbi:hypothetical protein TNCV_582591 [Trichonephila clavipes]|nr:hypothetical protein TNCV_582591 [Trichonephila clavipes]
MSLSTRDIIAPHTFFSLQALLPTKAVSVRLHHLDQFDAMFFRRLTPKSFNHFSTLSIHLVLGFPLVPFLSGVWKVIFLTGNFISISKYMSLPPYLGSRGHFD